MRIDSGLNGYYQQSRMSYSKLESDETANDSQSAARTRTQDPSVSSSFLSASLSGALWAMESSDQTDVSMGSSDSLRASAAMAGDAEQVQAFYLEYANA